MSGSAVSPATATPCRALLKDEGQIWLYIAKAMLALWLAGWLGMRLGMPSPMTCMITVLIVMNRQTGLVLAKAFYRGLGTLAGCVAGVAVVALFPQQPLLLLAAMALWCGGMAAGALVNRNMRAYTFVLAGYTVAMIVLPSVNNPAAVFDTAIWRVAEVVLGLVVASCVFDVAWPNRLHQPLQGLVRGNGRALLATVARVANGGLGDAPALAAEQRALGGQAVALEDLRSTALFDDPSLRASDGLLRQLNQRYLDVLTALQLLQRRWRRSAPAQADALQTALQPLGTLLAGAEGHSPGCPAALADWRAGIDALPSAMPGKPALLALADALDAYLLALQAADIDASHQAPAALRKAPPAFVRVTDPMAVLLTFARASGVMFALGGVWMLSGWTSGGSALFGIVALLSMLSAATNPAAVARFVSLGHLIAPILVLPFYSLLPALPSFPLLVLGTAPLFLLILRIGAHPPLAPLGMALNMGTMVALNFGLAPKVNPQFYLNDAVAIAIGAGLALLGFILIPNLTGSRGQRRRLLQLLRLQVRLAARGRLSGLRARFDSRSHDLVRQIGALTPPGSVAARRLDDWMAQVHEIGHAVIALRQWQATQPRIDPAARRALSALFDALVALHRRPTATARQQCLMALEATCAVIVDPGATALLATVQDVLADGHRALRPSLSTGGVSDAA